MDRGFWIILTGIAVIALGYAALSIMPVLMSDSSVAQQQTPQPQLVVNNPAPPTQSSQQRRPGQSQSQPPANNQSVQPSPGGQQAPGAMPQPSSHQGARAPAPKRPTGPPNLPPGHPVNEVEETPDPPVVWKYARRSVELCKEPQGSPHYPTCLNHAPLVVVRGSRLHPIEYQDDWVMVRSPGQTLGWVLKQDLADAPPVDTFPEY